MDGITIGIFDSGIGGLTVARAVHEAIPNARLIYFGDTARCPYGDRSPAEVRTFVLQIARLLSNFRVDLMVVACNTATAVALDDLRQRCNVPVLGVIEPGARAAVRSGAARIGVIGTVVTIASGAYEQAIHRIAPEAQVFGRACPAFVPLVEQGKLDGPDVEQIVRESLAPLLDAGVEALILGCTHYPLLQSVIQRVAGPHVRVISSAAETAAEVAARCYEGFGTSRASLARPWHLFMTSGAPERMRHALRDWFQWDEAVGVRIVHVSTDALAVVGAQDV